MNKAKVIFSEELWSNGGDAYVPLLGYVIDTTTWTPLRGLRNTVSGRNSQSKRL